MQRARGRGRIAVKTLHDRTKLDTLFQEGCAKIRLPRTHGKAIEAVLINTAGGLTGGDDLRWEANAEAGSRLVLTTQACERVYKSMGDVAHIECRLSAGAGAHLDWLPQETILFEDSRLDRTLEVDLDEGATFTAVEAVLLGRAAMGEAARSARMSDRWRIRRNGRLVHAEALRLTGSDDERDGIGLLAGNHAFATVLAITPDADRRLHHVREILAGTRFAAASAIGERLVVRIAAPSGMALRKSLAPVLALLSGTGALPRLWTI